MKIGVIMGGISTEREISLLSGQQVIKNLDKSKYEAVEIVINEKEDAFTKIKDIDFALIALHGKFGEDGSIQAILETKGIPYSGCGILAGALGVDKDMGKKVMVYDGVNTAPWITVGSVEEVTEEKISKLNFPLVVKPNSGGSSVATTIVNDIETLKTDVLDALNYDTEVIIEEFIKGEEITCCVLKGKMLPPLSIKPKVGTFFTYESKFTETGADRVAANFSEEVNKAIETQALRLWKAVKAEVYFRVDMIVREDGVPFVLEINTLPGMTETSLLPIIAGLAGYTFGEVLDIVIEESLRIRG